MRKLLIALSLFTSSVIANEFPMVINTVINATPPGAKVSAGYLTITNDTDKRFTLTGASSPDINKVEIHLSSIVNDIAKMEKQETISIEPGDTLKFEHGGYHLMLMGLSQPLKEGDSIDIVLETSSGDMLIAMPVAKMGASMGDMNNDDVKMGDSMNNDDLKMGDSMDNDDLKMGDSTDNDDLKDPAQDGDDYQGSTKVVH